MSACWVLRDSDGTRLALQKTERVKTTQYAFHREAFTSCDFAYVLVRRMFLAFGSWGKAPLPAFHCSSIAGLREDNELRGQFCLIAC